MVKMMNKRGFCQTWIKWILTCMSSVAYSFNINGERRGFVKPSRGLRQGDPLSPYLFLLVTEGFSNLLTKSMQGNRLTGLKVAHSCPALSHLFFADDTLIFCRANKEEAGEVMQILKQYGEASGQIVNMEKSSVFFGKNTDEDRRDEISKTKQIFGSPDGHRKI